MISHFHQLYHHHLYPTPQGSIERPQSVVIVYGSLRVPSPTITILAAPAFLSTDCFHVILGRPTLQVPWGFKYNAIRATHHQVTLGYVRSNNTSDHYIIEYS